MKPTLEFRWLKRTRDVGSKFPLELPPILQQRFVSEDGREEWRAVPVVQESLATHG